MIQVETVSNRSEPDDYLDSDNCTIFEYEWTDGLTKTAYLLDESASLIDAIMMIDHTTVIIETEPGHRYHDSADCVVRVYDGYNE